MTKLPVPTVSEIRDAFTHIQWEEFHHFQDRPFQGYSVLATTWEEDYRQCLLDYNVELERAVKMMERFWAWRLTK